MTKKGKKILIMIIVLCIVVTIGIIAYFVFINNKESKNLFEYSCIYNSKKEIICGTDFVMISKGVEYQLTKNEAFYFPQGENKLIGLIDKTKPEGQQIYFLFLKEGEYEINEETSRKAMGSFIAK
ncbi:MAG: hypothetical protein Q7S06_00295 [Nanoarchaeota archaeon]|nr:hypothetical protein [Nanoarchaeota archaeon]